MKRAIDKGLIVFALLVLIFLGIFSTLYYFSNNTIYLTILMLTPLVSVIISKIACKKDFKDLYLKPNFKGNKKWYLSAYLLTPVIAFIGALVYFLIFKNDIDLLGSRYAADLGVTSANEYISKLLVTLPLAMLVNPIMGIIQCFGEELAWRGYLLPKLNKKFSIQVAVIIDGFIWGLWHSPIIAMGYNYGDGHPILGIFAMIIFCIIIGIIASYLFCKTKSIWCPVLFHAALNGIDRYTPSALFMSKTPNAFIGPNLVGIIGGIGFVITATILFYKLKKETI